MLRRPLVTCAVAGSVALAISATPTGSSAYSTAQHATASPIQHIVVIYQENHSFDETLGAYCQSRRTPCNGFTGTVTLKGGVTVRMKPSPDVVPTVDHSVASQDAAIDGGRMDGWAQVHGCQAPNYSCLTYYPPSRIPNLTTLADHYAVADRMFSMADSPSWGGHLYAAAASLDGFTGNNPRAADGTGPGWGCDSKKLMQWRPNASTPYQPEPSCVPKPDGSGAFRATPVPYIPTIFDRLEQAGYSWHIYGQKAATDTQGPGISGYIWSICPSFAECLYSTQNQQLVPTARVLTDARNGTLPSYSILTPSWSSAKANGGADSSQHNLTSMTAGDNWIGRVVNAIAQGPDWRTTAIFITYDDCGCFYDHVAPGVNPDGTPQGPRMPMVIVSPYAKANYTDSNPASFASILAFTEHNFGLAPLNGNDGGAYDFASSFNYSQAPTRSAPLMHQRPLSPATQRFLRSHAARADDDDPT